MKKIDVWKHKIARELHRRGTRKARTAKVMSLIEKEPDWNQDPFVRCFDTFESALGQMFAVDIGGHVYTARGCMGMISADLSEWNRGYRWSLQTWRSEARNRWISSGSATKNAFNKLTIAKLVIKAAIKMDKKLTEIERLNEVMKETSEKRCTKDTWPCAFIWKVTHRIR
ncbi:MULTISPECIES: hypothetical protein [Paenibacillus]|uniref:hypothetical protein n=1 Tax=Paenibacillus TaxID=44249 RepID=UPI0022B8A562|nr:hypothetical protein [Paenibacillus caseinilyticus]MCZ8518386.1 hypothetical protein [Paenibacillus caseinilyticus]